MSAVQQLVHVEHSRLTEGVLSLMNSAHFLQARQKAVVAGDGMMEYVPVQSKPGEIVGSDLTAFFAATVNDPTISGIRLRPGNYLVNAGANPDAHIILLCNPRNPRRTPFTIDLSGSTLIFEV